MPSATSILFHGLAAVLWQSPLMLPVAIAAAALLVAAVLWLYLPQVRTLGRPWRWVLPALRVLVLAVLAVSLLKPVVVRPKTLAEHGAVVLLVDRSRSMSVADARAPAELVSLAAGLGLLPEGVRDQQTTRLGQAAEQLARAIDEASRARSELEYATLADRGTRPAQERLDDLVRQVRAAAAALAEQATAVSATDSLHEQLAALRQIPEVVDEPVLGKLRSGTQQTRAAIAEAQRSSDAALHQSNAQVRQICDEIGKLTRLGLVEKALRSGTAGLLSHLPEGTPLYAFGFSGDIVPLPGLDPGGGLVVEGAGYRSDITGAVRKSQDRVKGRTVQGVVLLSDGRQVGGDSAVASGLSAVSGVPVFAVDAAAALQRDVAVVDVDMPQSQFVGETTTVRVHLRGTGLEKRPLGVKLRSDDGSVEQTRTITFADDAAAVAEFQVKFSDRGVRMLSVAADAADGEVSTSNNMAQRRLKVLDDKVAVTALSSSAGWDYQYVRNALSRTAWVTLTDAIVQDGGQQAQITPERLLEQDLVVLSDLGVSNLSPAQWDAIVRLVTERAGSVILMASEPRMLVEFGSNPLLASLLPYESGMEPVWRTWPGEEPNFRLVPAPEARDNPALRLDTNPGGESRQDDSADRWHQLSPVFGYLPIPTLKPNTLPLLVERESGAPVLTDSRLGLGRVMLMGTGETWRWRNKVGERDHDRFWLQLIRYAVDEPYAVRDEAGRLFLDAGHVQAEPGQPVQVRAKVLGPDGLPSRAAAQVLRVKLGGKLVRDLPLSAIGAAGSGRYEGVLDELPVGEYDLLLGDPAEPGREVSVPLVIAAAAEAEMIDLSGDAQLLRRLGESSGGQYLTLGQLDTLSARMTEARRRQSQLAEHRLWDSPYLFGLVLACLGAEWAIRKRVGLA
jgi:hypothetical protein